MLKKNCDKNGFTGKFFFIVAVSLFLIIAISLLIYDYSLPPNSNNDTLNNSGIVDLVSNANGLTNITNITTNGGTIEISDSGGPGGSSGGNSGGNSGGTTCTPSISCNHYYNLNQCGNGLSDGCTASLNCVDIVNGTCQNGSIVAFSSCTSDTNCSSLNGACATGKCNLSSGNCYANYLAGSVCHPASDECDAVEVCQNGMIDCPTNVNKTNGATCNGGTCQNGQCVASSVCGDGVCSAGENCPADATSCPDNACYEPTCTNSCGQTVVSSNANDEGCVLPNFCDGAGNCGICIADADCSDGKNCVNGKCLVGECSADADCSSRGPGFICNQTNSQCEWLPPIGIPKPEFGIEETYRMYDDPANRNPNLTYYQNSEGGFYTHYIDNTNPNATDTNNDYGTAGKPRLTIPKSVIAGSVVEVHGTLYEYHNGPSGEVLLEGIGTKERPIFVRGAGVMPRINHELSIGYYGNAQYIIIENINASGLSIIARSNSANFTVNHIVLRHSDIGNQGGVGITSWSINNLSNIVIYDTKVHERGIWDPDLATGDRDAHCIAVGRSVSYLWILDGQMYHCEGDGLQINSNPGTVSHNLYIGRNIVHDNKQSGLWTKYSEDTIFSENTLYHFRSSSSSPGTCTGWQYGPLRTWFLFNNISDCEQGIGSGSASGPGFDGPDLDKFMIGNIIHNIHHFDSAWNPVGTPDCIQGSAFCMRGGINRTIIGNTIYDIDAGISLMSGSGSSDIILNNIISNISGISYSHHLRLDDRDGFGIAKSIINNNLFFGGNTCIITNMNYLDCKNLSRFNSSFGKCQNCLEADPLFVNASANDFHLQPNSPAIDSGATSEVYQRFYDLYGINISKDIERQTRPQGNGWDIGAYEYSTQQGMQASENQGILNWFGNLVGDVVKNITGFFVK